MKIVKGFRFLKKRLVKSCCTCALLFQGNGHFSCGRSNGPQEMLEEMIMRAVCNKWSCSFKKQYIYVDVER